MVLIYISFEDPYLFLIAQEATKMQIAGHPTCLCHTSLLYDKVKQIQTSLAITRNFLQIFKILSKTIY